MKQRKDPKGKAVSTPLRKGTSKAKKKTAPKRKPLVRSQGKAKPEPVPPDTDMLTDEATTQEKLRADFQRFMEGDAFPLIRHRKKRASLWALTKTYGLVKPAAQMVRFDRSSYYNWRNDDADYYDATEQCKEDMLDLAQSKLVERINGVKVAKGEGIYDLPPDVTAILGLLNNLGKKRGFNAPIEVHHRAGTKVLIPNVQEE